MNFNTLVTSTQDSLREILGIYCWRDGAEILILSLLVYFALKWLQLNANKHLLITFYTYSALIGLSYYADLTIISSILLLCAPILGAYFLIFHEHRLQKNYIVYKNIKPAEQINNQWIDELVRGMLTALNRHKEIVCVIERQDKLDSLLATETHCNAELKKKMIELLIDHMSPNPHHMLWARENGKIIAINTYLKIQSEPAWSSNNAHLNEWKTDAAFITNKTDAVILHLSPISRTFDVMAKGNIIHDLTAPQTLTLLKRYFQDRTSLTEETFFHAYSNSAAGKQHHT